MEKTPPQNTPRRHPALSYLGWLIPLPSAPQSHGVLVPVKRSLCPGGHGFFLCADIAAAAVAGQRRMAARSGTSEFLWLDPQLPPAPSSPVLGDQAKVLSIAQVGETRTWAPLVSALLTRGPGGGQN